MKYTVELTEQKLRVDREGFPIEAIESELKYKLFMEAAKNIEVRRIDLTHDSEYKYYSLPDVKFIASLVVLHESQVKEIRDLLNLLRTPTNSHIINAIERELINM